MGILGWIAGGCVIGAGVATILTGGAALPLLAVATKTGSVVVAVGAAEAGAVVGGCLGYVGSKIRPNHHRPHRHNSQRSYDQRTPRTEMDHVRRNVAYMEEHEQEEKAQRRERVSMQPFMVFCVLRCNNREEATWSHSGQIPEEIQGAGTQTHHGSTSKQRCEAEAAAGGGSSGGGGSPGGGGGWSDGEDGDSDQEGSDSEKSDSEEESQQTGEPKKRKSHQKKSKRQRRGGRATVLTANLWSLNNKEFRVLTLMQENQVDVACLTETFLDQNIADELLSRASGPNFNYQFRNRQVPVSLRRPKRSGGVAILFSTDLLGEPCHFGPTITFEYDARVVQHRDWVRPIVFICLYRRPGQTRRVLVQFLQELETLLDQVRLVSQSIIVTGDFNIWVDQEMRASRMFQSFLDRNHLHQHVNQPTHRSGHTLDLVLTRNVQISDVSVGNNQIKDHYPVFFKARPDQSSEEEEEEEEGKGGL